MARSKKSKEIFKNKNLFWYVVLIFIIIRLILNLIPPLNALFIGFAIIYSVFAVWQIKNYKYFATALIIFLIIDSIIGAYIFALENMTDIEFYGTVGINLIMMLILLRNPRNSFRN